MMQRLVRLLALAAWLATAPVEAEQPRRVVAVRVLEISGGHAYLSAGTGAGLRVGSRVMFGDRTRRVERATLSYAVVSARRLRVGDRGRALAARSEGEVVRLPRPRPLSAFAGQWPAAVLPASRQRPKPVPLGGFAAREERIEASLAAAGAAFVPLERGAASVYRAELRGRMVARPIADVPVALHADVALQRWFGSFAGGVASGDPRPLVRVRELSLELGRHEGFRAEIGRLRYAAIHLGPIDGGRFEAARLGPLRIAGFGGLLPDPIDGRFARGAGRFGLELDLRSVQPVLRRELTVVLQGSVFEGELDERRLYARGQLWPGEHRLSAYAEAARFDADNPWRRPALDLAAAGADVELRFGPARFGGRFDMRKPERSSWLARALPDTWLCGAAATDVRCARGDDTRYLAQLFGGADLGRAQLDLGGSWVGSSERTLGQHVFGYATLRLLRLGRYDLALGGTHEGGTLLRASTSARAEVGSGFFDDRVRLSAYYRPAYKRYRASIEGILEHGTGVTLHAAPSRSFALDLLGDVRIGDVNAALVMLTMIYRVAR